MNLVVATEYSRQTGLRDSFTVQLSIRLAEISDLSNFERGIIVGATHGGSSISETAGHPGFYRMA